MCIAVDNDGNIYIGDWQRHDVQKLSQDGVYLATISELGTAPSNMNTPDSLWVDNSGNIYVAELGNVRIQKFKKVDVPSNSKAIIIAGGGPYQGNNLWNATQISANFVYRTLTYQGFTKESIYYLTSDTSFDLDGNGVLDDIDADAVNANLEYAITDWALDAENLVVYLVDHGGDGTFRMSGTESLSAADLDSWLDLLQGNITGRVTVIYDACESGSFLSVLSPLSGKERTVITSTSPGESAYFISQGSVSFSNYFWTHIFNGLNIKDAFDLTVEALGYTTTEQNPLLDANGNGIPNEPEDVTLVQNTYIGNGTVIYGDAPVIGTVNPEQTINNTSAALLYADSVTDDDGIARVWVTIRPPDFNQGSSDNPVQEMPSIDLMPVDGQPGRYGATYDSFNIEGTYQVVVYARDRIGNTSIPRLTTVIVNNPLRRKAIILAGASQIDPLWPTIEKNALHAYDALRFQGYADDDVYFMSPVTFSSGVDVSNTSSNLQYAIEDWGTQSTQDVVIYLIGNGNDGILEVSDTDTVTSTELDTWIDTLQASIPGKVTVIYDACNAGSFVQALIPPENKQRICIASAGIGQPAYFLSGGDISFSRFFWGKVANGTNLRDAFVHAQRAIRFSCSNQTPVLDDSGNGIGNEKIDGRVSRYYTIGAGIMLAGDDPLIDVISPQQTVALGGTATIWVENVTTTGAIDRVWAVITPPNYNPASGDPVIELPEVELADVGNNWYEGTFSGFTGFGTYQVAAYAMDTDGNISMPKETTVCYVVCTDDYEGDDTFDQSNII
ncbi:C13 family peptidase, partial [Thermodesulfobacteriota bacterium]